MDNLTVSFVVIALNAGSTLDTLLECLKRQTYPHGQIEMNLVDRNSQDASKEKKLRFQSNENDLSIVVVLDSPKKTLLRGRNVALDVVDDDTVLRMDTHITFLPEFIELKVCDLRNKGENICGGRVISIPAS